VSSLVVIVSFIACMGLILSIGTLSVLYKKKKPEDYLIASRGTPAWLAALSAVGTNNSGFMFVGMIAYTYRLGIESVWMMVGWILGDLAAWYLVHPRVRQQSPDVDAQTLPAFMGRREGGEDRWIVIAAGAITFLFLGVYAAGQIKAGATALHAVFGWDMYVGALIGAAIVILYSYAGGIRADIWTDAAQSFLMLGTMVLILAMGALQVGGPAGLFEALRSQDPDLMNVIPENLQFGFVAFLIGMLFAGFSSTGQPHLMTRYMAIESVEAIRPARWWYFGWFIPFFAASVGVGLYCRAIIPDLASLPLAQAMEEPTELALPLLTMRLLPEVFVGIVLAGLFAATASTADSQIIVCSGAVTQDIFPRWEKSYLAGKVATFVVTAMSLGIALFAPEGVFGLVLIAWSAMGAGLGPILMVRVFKLPLHTATAMTMMFVAIVTVVGWHWSGLDDEVFKAFPGFVAAGLVYAIAAGVRRLRTTNG